MNQAKLKTTLTKQITVDTSSPHQGMVHDGKYDTPEIDVQSDLELFAHWGGFFDRESGVKFYLYGFSTSCLGANKFQLNLANRQDIQQTTSTHASWTAPSDGKYYITVVAYNGALEVSLPVCSDGVVVDRTIGRPVIDPNKDTKTSISVSRGETGVLSIHVLAYPLPEFTWYYQLQDGSERPIIDVRCNQTDDGLSSTLTIQNVTVDDGRKYIVYVNNSLGTISIVFNMAVLLSSDDDVHGSNNTLLGIGIGVGLGIILFILLGIIFMRTGRRICFQKKTGNDQTVFDDARNQQTKSDNISLSEIPPIYEIVDTDAVNTRDPTDPDHIISETTPSPYEVLDIQATNLQHNIYQELNAPPESTYEGLDKQTTDQQSNIYEQLDLYENVTGTKMKGKDNAK
ncbi:uncharacterized protein LOC126829741 [Patella vulgata]|uniref:uncharacterized protein LOC126829741 n=1 Tax=Patella vulgata TaxID=6465 RepID=UPI00217F3842|nr:uncharacterized protein LOC126829741 [Patella vulgata]